MTTLVISSRSNPIIEELRDQREESGFLFLEGFHLVEEILKTNHPILHLIVVGSLEESDIVRRAMPRSQRTTLVTPYVFKTLSRVEEPQGILAICPQLQWTWVDITRRLPAPLVILDGIQNPGNAGGILRTAEAAGAAGVATTSGTAHLYGDKALRAGMGSTLRLPIIEHMEIDALATHVTKAGYQLLGADSREAPGAVDYTQIDWAKPWAIVIGQEGQGLSDAWKPHLATSVTIPMARPVESLNVGAATAVLLFESFRKRRPSA